MAKVRGAVEVEIERCKGCGLCIEACPTQVLQLAKQVNGKGYNYCLVDKPEACIGCTNCALVCPDGVISVYRVNI
jgi:2-oxoglutarate ferredoxin oxidoreductase subunit delta